MNVQKVFLEAVGVKEAQYPTSGLPEVAFAGKSNVGKSSLIKEFKARVSDECLCVEVDCWNSTRNAYDFFIEYIVQETLKSNGKIGRIKE